MSKAKRKPPEMPKWFWYAIVDGCWFCKKRNACGTCKAIRDYRKEAFPKKVKGRNGGYDHKKDSW